MQRPDVWVSRSRLWAFPPFLKEQGWSLSYCFLLVVCFGLLPGWELNSISSESASVQILVCIYFASHLAVRILLSGPVTHFFCVLICFPLHPTWRWSSSIYIYTVHFKTKTKGPLWSEGHQPWAKTWNWDEFLVYFLSSLTVSSTFDHTHSLLDGNQDEWSRWVM